MGKILLKPHHFVDIICSFGTGKREFEPHQYGHTVHIVSEQLLKNPQCEIQIETDADDICLPCVHLLNGDCLDEIDNSYRPQAPKSKQEWNLRIDLRWCKHLGIKNGDIIDSRDMCKRIEENIGNLFRIYPEIPIEMIARRKDKLINGLEFFKSL